MHCRWVHCGLFSSMVASTDAVAVSACLKAGGAPEVLSALLEGESLFNDARCATAAAAAGSHGHMKHFVDPAAGALPCKSVEHTHAHDTMSNCQCALANMVRNYAL